MESCSPFQRQWGTYWIKLHLAVPPGWLGLVHEPCTAFSAVDVTMVIIPTVSPSLEQESIRRYRDRRQDMAQNVP